MRKRIILFFLSILCLFMFLLTGCKDNENSSMENQNHSEENSWSDENVDDGGWT